MKEVVSRKWCEGGGVRGSPRPISMGGAQRIQPFETHTHANAVSPRRMLTRDLFAVANLLVSFFGQFDRTVAYRNFDSMPTSIN